MSDHNDNMDDDLAADQARNAEELPKKRKRDEPPQIEDIKVADEQRIAQLKELEAALDLLPFKAEFFHALDPQSDLKPLLKDLRIRRKAILHHLAKFPLSEATAGVSLASTDWALLSVLPKSLRFTVSRLASDDEDADSSDDEFSPQDTFPAVSGPNMLHKAPTLATLSDHIREANGLAKNLRLVRKKFRHACRSYVEKQPNEKYSNFVKALNGVVCQWITFIGNLDILLQEGIKIEIPGMTWLIGHPDHRRFLNKLHSLNKDVLLLPDDFIVAQNRLCSASCFLAQSYSDLYRFNIDTFEFDRKVDKDVMDGFVEIVENLKNFSNRILDTIGFSPDFPFHRVHTEKVLNDLDRRKQRQSKEVIAYPPTYVQNPGRGGRPRGRGRGTGRGRGGSYRGRQ